MGKKTQVVAPPDYVGAAKETAAGNLAAAETATAANRVSQYTPYGNLVYQQTGTDTKGNPLWSATTSLSPGEQALYNQQLNTSLGLGKLQDLGLGYVQDMISKPFSTANLPQVGINPGENYSAAIMRQLEPQIKQDRASLDAKLANQGIMQGSEAYENAMRQQGMREAQLRDQAIVGGMQTGLAANQQAFGQEGYIRNEPINTLSAIRSGSQVTNPQFTSVPQQATTAGPDIMGATQGTYNAQLANANAQNAANAAMTSGLFGLGGAGLMRLSDIRTKENIVLLGYLPNGLPVYEYEYKEEFKNNSLGGFGKQIGVMAQEVEKLIPEAVKTLANGFKAVNYGAIL